MFKHLQQKDSNAYFREHYTWHVVIPHETYQKLVTFAISGIISSLCKGPGHGTECTRQGCTPIIKVHYLFQYVKQNKSLQLAFCLILWSKGRESIRNHKDGNVFNFEMLIPQNGRTVQIISFSLNHGLIYLQFCL